MIGAIAGDIIGSVYEHHPIKTVNYPLFHSRCRFTDDSVLTVAIAYAILNGVDYATALKSFGRKYPRAGYGGAFVDWIFAVESRPYNSWGNVPNGVGPNEVGEFRIKSPGLWRYCGA
jgi:hypothetical protein